MRSTDCKVRKHVAVAKLDLHGTEQGSVNITNRHEFNYNDYIVFGWIIAMSLFGLNGLSMVLYIALASKTYLAFLLNLKQSSQLRAELFHMKSTFLEILFLAFVLFIEINAIYIISFINPNKYNEERLYDPVRAMLRHVKAKPLIHPIFMFLKRHIFTTSSMYFVAWGVILCLSASWHDYRRKTDGKRISVAKLGQKLLRGIAVGHGIRTVCFMVTVLPSQFKNCYIKKLTDHVLTEDTDIDLIKETDEWSWSSSLRHKQSGGCNDLMFSGHFTIIMNVCLLFNEVYGNYFVTDNKWLLRLTMVYLYACAAFAGIDMITGGHHYSVDVLVAIIFTFLFWNYLSDPRSYLHIDLTLYSDQFKKEFHDSFIAWMYQKFKLDSSLKERAFLTMLIFVILLIAFAVLLPGS